MFVSSYNTFIQPEISTKESRQRVQKDSIHTRNFSKNFSPEQQNTPNSTNIEIPLDYIQKNQTYANKQRIKYQTEQLENQSDNNMQKTMQTISILKTQNSLANAQNAYQDNFQSYSVYSKQATSLNQTLKVDHSMPHKVQTSKELSMRHTMISTYLSNDKYYQLTA